MEYRIKYVAGEPCFDTLGVIKLGCMQSVPINDRIYAQAQLGRNDDSLFVRILSFEPKPLETARLTAEFRYAGKVLRLSVTAAGLAEARCGAVDLTPQMTAYLSQGEDLQGEYWAGVMLLSLDAFFTALDVDKTVLPLTLTGNILRENPALSAAAPAGETVTFAL